MAKGGNMTCVKRSKFQADFTQRVEAMGITKSDVFDMAHVSSAAFGRGRTNYMTWAGKNNADQTLDLMRLDMDVVEKLCERLFLKVDDYIVDDPEPMIPEEPEPPKKPGTKVIKPVKTEPAAQPEMYDELFSMIETLTKVIAAEGTAIDKLVKQAEQENVYLEELTRKTHGFDAKVARIEGVLGKMEQSMSGIGKMIAEARKPFDDLRNKTAAVNQMANSIWQNTKQINRIVAILDAWASGR